ncbi:MAG: hypothetical protein AVDCRST_MAG89-677 [uncultured Gemmatimonadetes bacterium]|uniref:DUF4349 domain-containing protein n=1 Tax=uncultured Gemmatimonadota bacterium TaxID=203437 RepID=A0A6J4KGE6_9BACT|nr:MAG: hypothetical protein AVDCRST_MAG89-677 [uncultured Gemmatimonadota bacterium]
MIRIYPLLSLALVLAASACSSSRSMSDVAPMAAGAPSGPGAPRAVIQQAGLSMVTDSLARLHRVADSVTVALGGYVGEAELRESELHMSLRVPAPALNGVLDHLSGMGTVKRRTVRRQDVTAQVVDVEARLGTLRTVRDRLRAYLSQAAATADLVAIERELARVQGEIDQLEAHQRMLSTRVELAEVSLDARRPRILGPLGWIVSGLATLIEKLFVIRD